MRTFARHAVLALAAALVLVPFAWMVYTSALTQRESVAGFASREIRSPTEQGGRIKIVADNYRTALTRAPFARYFLNTILVTAIITVSVVVTSVLAGFAFGMLEFPAKKWIFLCFVATLMIPFEVTLLPNYILVSRIKQAMTDFLGLEAPAQYLALVLPWLTSAFGVFLMRQHFASLERDYYDAARLDGCGHLRFLWSVAVPMLKPAVVTVALFVFVGSWNAFLWPLVITDNSSYRVIQNGLYSFIAAEGINYNQLMAAATVCMLPTVAVFLIAQRTFVEGVGAGGVKM